MSSRTLSAVICTALATASAANALRAAEQWEAILKVGIQAEHSQTRHDALKQVDTTTAKGIRSLCGVLSSVERKDPLLFDWYVRQGTYEALLRAEGEEAEKEVDKILKGSRYELTQEAILYAIIWKIRTEAVNKYAGDDDRRRENFKYHLRKTTGTEYFELILPVIETFDPEKRYLKRLQDALGAKSLRVRRAAIAGLTAYPDKSSIPLLIKHLKSLERKRKRRGYYREWVVTRYALEILTGQNFRNDVSNWEKWWKISQGEYTLKKMVEKAKKEQGTGRTVVIPRGGVEVTLTMKTAGEGYPLLVLPWQGYEVDYFRPYFHGIEEFCKAFYVRMPRLDDFKGLARTAKANIVTYPTKILSEALRQIMKDSKLDRFAILAHGPDAVHLGLLLASADPDKVSHIILINPRSAGSRYGDAIERVKREGTRRSISEVVKGAKNILIDQTTGKPIYLPADAAEAGGMGRALFNLKFADPTEPEVGTFKEVYRLPGGVKCMNDSSWDAKSLVGTKLQRTPALIFMGEKAVWTPMDDMQRVTGLFRGARVVKMKNSAECPFMSETFLFTRHVEEFLSKAVTKMRSSKAKRRSSGRTSRKR